MNDPTKEPGPPIFGGDRAAIAEFVLRHGPLIRRRLRGRIARGWARVFDLDDVLATIVRRIDGLVLSGELQARSEAQLQALIWSIAEHALADHARMARRENGLRQASAESVRGVGAEASCVATRIEEVTEARHVESKIAGTREDHIALRMRICGNSTAQVAAAIGATAAAVRMRCIRLRDRVTGRQTPQDGRRTVRNPR